MTDVQRITALQRMARYRVMRRMQKYNRQHALVAEATKLSIRIGELYGKFDPFSPEFRRG